MALMPTSVSEQHVELGELGRHGQVAVGVRGGDGQRAAVLRERPVVGEAWRAPAEAYSLIATRLVGSGKRAELPEFSIRCATVEGVVTHHLRAETHRDLAAWAKALVNGSHASAVTQKELVCRCVWKGRPAQLVIHYENGFTLLEAGTGSRTLWRYSFDKLRNSSDDGKRYLWLDFGSGEESEVTTLLWANLMYRWDDDWRNGQNGRWTYQLIPGVQAWIDRPYGEVDYFLTQALSGLG
ncbi:hypothetical protein NQ318_011992 [Aromia moschata]|uniref:Syntrophin C-terminal PH domain-containing protein n=1 Tax=Aromia moschata TaxID=1265417 RepID=A0AAV8XHI6_9CUCU|nr:hypothetical protein NQ318_011992 [Aromia moschata]